MPLKPDPELVGAVILVPVRVISHHPPSPDLDDPNSGMPGMLRVITLGRYSVTFYVDESDLAAPGARVQRAPTRVHRG